MAGCDTSTVDGYDGWFGVAGGMLITFSQEHIVTYRVRIRRLVGRGSNATCQWKANREEGGYVADGGS